MYRILFDNDMNKDSIRTVQLILTPLLLLIGMLYGCANRVAPDGGPYDVTPPKLVGAKPEDKALNVTKKKVVLTFDEYVQIKDVSTKVIISPPQLQQPKIMAVGKRVTVALEDDLIPNTTYTIDFTDAIVDNNEGNPLENFSYAFSTGNEIDTMEISGKVLNIRNHEPMQGLLVGIQPDSAGWNAFTDTTLLRMSRTGDRAQFVMRNIKEGKYRVYALKESDGNYRHDMPTEGIAFLDSLITTTSMASTRQDTLWVDSLTIDTIKTVPYTRYLPDDLVLMYYEPQTPRRYISKRERPDSMQIKLTFNLLPKEGIEVKALELKDSLLREVEGTPPIYDLNQEKHEATAFFTDPDWKGINQFVVSYQSVDSLNLPTQVSDTLKLNLPKPPKKETKEEKEETKEKDKKSKLTIRIEHKGDGGVNDSILFHTSLPIDTAAFKAFELFNANDSILKPLPIDSIWMLPDRATSGMIKARLQYNTSYELYVDSAKFVDVYGHHLAETAVDAFKTQPKEEFAQLTIDISGVEGPFIGELLSTDDKPIRTIVTDQSKILFADLKPQKYAFRLIIDGNGNGQWDPGSYRDSIQPEQVYYMPKILEVMKNWKVTETFTPLTTPIDHQKPKEMIKNKPKATERKDRNKEREEELKKRRSGTGDQGGMNTGMGGLGGLGGMMPTGSQY